MRARVAAATLGCALALAGATVHGDDAPATSASVVAPAPSMSADAAAYERLKAALAAKREGLAPKKVGDLLEPLSKGPRDTDLARETAARASYSLGELYEEAHIYDQAIAHYRDVLTIDPGNYYASTARARIDALAKFDGDFKLLAILDGVRQNTVRASDKVSLLWLEGIVGTWSPSRAKDEAWLFLAVAWGGRMHEPERAIAPALSLAHRAGADAGLRATAYAVAYDAMSTLGDLDQARATIASDANAPATLRTRIERDFKRRTLHRASVRAAQLGGFSTVAAIGVAIIRGRARAMAKLWLQPQALAAIAIASIGAWWLGEAWEGGQGEHFLVFGGAMLGVHLLVGALRGAIGDRATGVRLIGALIAVSTVVASAYLILERGELRGVPLLSGFGL